MFVPILLRVLLAPRGISVGIGHNTIPIPVSVGTVAAIAPTKYPIKGLTRLVTADSLLCYRPHGWVRFISLGV